MGGNNSAPPSESQEEVEVLPFLDSFASLLESGSMSKPNNDKDGRGSMIRA